MQPRKILQLVAFTLFSFSLNSTTFTFTGPGDWDESQNWDQFPGNVIAEFDTVIINERCIIKRNINLINNGIFLTDGDAIIEVLGNFENNGVYQQSGLGAYFGVTNNGVLTNNGQMEVSGIFDIWVSGSFYNYGSFVSQNAEIKNLSDFENLGFMDIGPNVVFENFRDFINEGTELNLKGLFINQNNNSSIENFSDFILHDNSEIELNGPMINDGKLKGNGLISGPSPFINKGEINPGFSPGEIIFDNSSLVDSASAKTIIEIEGNSAGDYDQISGLATKTLDGTLNLSFDGYTPSSGDQFPILEGPLEGAFTQVNISGLDPNMTIELIYTPTGIDLMVDGALPLDLISFEVKESNSFVEIKWVTQNEIDFHGYIIERSTNQREWEEIQFFTSKNEGRNSFYRFQDIGAKLGSNYYRLKMINLDESFEYSKVEHIKLREERNAVNIYPNPFIEQIYFNQVEAQNFEVYSDKGKLVKTGFANNVNMMAFSSGKYYLKLGARTIPIIKIK
jgi:hypothetical protein